MENFAYFSSKFKTQTISLIGENTGEATGNSITVTQNTYILGSVLSPGSYYYMGTGMYYLSGSSDISNQDVQVVISEGNITRSVFTLAAGMPQQTLSLFRVEIFYSNDLEHYFLVFMPDYRLVDSRASNIRAASGEPANSGVFVVSGSKRK